MDLRKNTFIDTHENVEIEYETANVGSRFLANLLDEIIIILTIILIALILILSLFEGSIFNFEVYIQNWNISIVIGIILIVFFILKYFYNVFFEMILRGQTPGKKAVKIRVIQTTGEPINFLSSFIRNLLRLVDELPARYLVGGIVVAYSKKSQRLGDLLANTMVVKIRTSKKLMDNIDSLIETEDINLGLDDLAILASYLNERESFNNNKELDIKLFNYFYKKIKLPMPPVISPSYSITYLERVHDYYSTIDQQT